ncbi:MAG: WbqC family protein [Prevotella sp.]|nr:WbqC family protein [Prevotella sp.]
MVFPCFYLPPVSWFSAVLRSAGAVYPFRDPISIELEAYENFHKQTLRNRCYICSPGGRAALTIPVDKSNFSAKGKCLMRDIRISGQYDWRKQHLTAFESSYYSSPFFEFLIDDFRPIYNKEWVFLMDFNEALTEKCFDLLGVNAALRRTDNYAGAADTFTANTRSYYQVFASKHGFIPDLSIVDLLFNTAAEAVLYL